MAFHPFIYYFSLKYVNCWFDEEGYTGTDPVSLFVGGWALINFILVTVNQLFDVPIFSLMRMVYIQGALLIAPEGNQPSALSYN